MKKLLLRIFLFLFTLPATYLLVIAFLTFTNLHNLFNVRLNPAGEGSTMVRMQEAAKTGKVDFLFIGSSHAYRSFDPRLFMQQGYSSFNLGTTAQSPINSYFLLQEHLSTIKPKYLVMDVYWEVLDDNGAEASIDLLSNAPLSRNMVKMALASKDISIFNTLVAAAMRQTQKPLSRVNSEIDKAEQYVAGGYLATKLNHNQELAGHPFKTSEAKLNPEQLAYLEKIIDLARSQGTKPIFVVTPVTTEHKASVSNYNSFTRQLSAYFKSHDAAFFEFNDEEYNLNLSSETDFYDMHHLTQSGVTKFNRIFIQLMQTKKIID